MPNSLNHPHSQLKNPLNSSQSRTSKNISAPQPTSLPTINPTKSSFQGVGGGFPFDRAATGTTRGALCQEDIEFGERSEIVEGTDDVDEETVGKERHSSLI